MNELALGRVDWIEARCKTPDYKTKLGIQNCVALRGKRDRSHVFKIACGPSEDMVEEDVAIRFGHNQEPDRSWLGCWI